MSEILEKKSRLWEDGSYSTSSSCFSAKVLCFGNNSALVRNGGGGGGWLESGRKEQVVWNEAEKQSKWMRWILLCQSLKVIISDIYLFGITQTN